MKLLMLAAHPEVDVWPLPDLLLLLVLEAGGSEDSPGCGLEPLSLRFLTYALPKVSRDGPSKGHYSRRGPWKSKGPSGEFFSEKQGWEKSPSCQFQHRVSKEYARDSAFVISE